MNFDKAIMKGAKADLVKRQITLTFTVSLDEQQTVEALTEYQGKGVALRILPMQLRFTSSWTESVPGTNVRGAPSPIGEAGEGEDHEDD